jgi:hypothetical protein
MIAQAFLDEAVSVLDACRAEGIKIATPRPAPAY